MIGFFLSWLIPVGVPAGVGFYFGRKGRGKRE